MGRNRGTMGLSSTIAFLMVIAGGLFFFAVMQWYDAARERGWEILWWVVVLAGLGSLSAAVARWQVVGPILDFARHVRYSREDSGDEPAVNLPPELKSLDFAVREARRKAKVSADGRAEAERSLHALATAVAGQWRILREKAELQSKGLEDAHGEIRAVEDRLKEMSGAVEQLGSHSDESGKGAEELTRILAEGHTLSRKVIATSAGLLERGQEILGALDDLDSEAMAFERATQTAASTVGRVTDLAKVMTASAGELARSTSELNQIASEGGRVVKEVNSFSRETSQAVLEDASIIRELGARSGEIGAVVEVIESIADETNLLALNAAIIAAQAGEHGRSFAVVADEIRELAERTSSSTKEVADLVKDVQDGIGRATRSIEQSAEKVQQSANLAEEAGEIWEKIRGGTEKNVRLAESITHSCKEQSLGTDSLGQAVEGVISAVDGVRKKVRSHKGIEDRASKNLSALQGLADDWGGVVPRAAELMELLNRENRSATTVLRRVVECCSQGCRVTVQAKAQIDESRELSARQVEILQEQGGVLKASQPNITPLREVLRDETAEDATHRAEIACE